MPDADPVFLTTGASTGIGATAARVAEPEDVARAALLAVSQPPPVDVDEILVRPTAQSG